MILTSQRRTLKSVSGITSRQLPGSHRQPTNLLALHYQEAAFMPMHEFMRHQVQLFGYYNGGYLPQTMVLPTAQETLFGLWIFLSSVRLPINQPESLTSSRRRSSQKRRRRLIFPLLVAMTQTTHIIVAITVTTIKATNAIATNINTTVAIETIDTTIILITKRKTTRKSPTRR
jgi:hypothetical protein